MAINVTSSLVDNHAMPMCSVAAAGSTAESLHCNIDEFPESCMVSSACAGISGVCSVAGRVGVKHAYAGICGVCSVAGRVGVDRFLEMRPWFCNLFLMKLIARNAARKDVHKPKELTSTNDAKQIDLDRPCVMFNKRSPDRLWGYFVYEGSELISSTLFF